MFKSLFRTFETVRRKLNLSPQNQIISLIRGMDRRGGILTEDDRGGENSATVHVTSSVKMFLLTGASRAKQGSNCPSLGAEDIPAANEYPAGRDGAARTDRTASGPRSLPTGEWRGRRMCLANLLTFPEPERWAFGSLWTDFSGGTSSDRTKLYVKEVPGDVNVAKRRRRHTTVRFE
jgi:hypothetical protein